MSHSAHKLISVRSRVALIALGLVLVVTGLSASTAGARSHHKKKPHNQALKGPLRKAKVKMVTVAMPGGRGGSSDPGDDYPARLKNAAQDSLLDQWREYNRECTSFAAWALASRNGFNMPFYANARDWGPKARALGYAVNSTPAPGSIAWSDAGRYGHVAYVQDVVGGSVHIEEYNYYGTGRYNSRTVPASRFTGYIHFRDVVPEPAAPAPAPSQPSGGSSTNPAPTTYAETTGGVAHTWTNYTNAGGYEGPSIGAFQTVQIACRLTGFKVADGNTWWYRIASSPWNGQYYVSADAFYNNGQTSGSLHGTPFVDAAVRDC